MIDKSDPNQRRKPPAVSFEVQVFAGGKWATELVLHDRQEAEDEANRTLDSSRRPLGVRVVREEVDEKTSLITSTTVFRKTREDERSTESKQNQMKAKVAEIKADRRQTAKQSSARAETQPPATAQASGRKPAGAKRSFHWAWLLILLTVLIVAGLLTLLKLHSVFLE